MTLCLYNPADPDSLRFLQISINQPGGASYGVSPAQIFQDIRNAMSDGRTDLDGLGDTVFIATGGIYVLQGERMISIGAGQHLAAGGAGAAAGGRNIVVRRLDNEAAFSPKDDPGPFFTPGLRF